VASVVTPTRVLIGTLIVFTLLAVVVAFETPPGEANDEPSHLKNIETIAGGRLYRITPSSGAESHQAPLYYGVLAGWQVIWGVSPFSIALLPPEAPLGNRPHPGPHWAHNGPTAAADQQRIDLLRLPGVAMSLATIILTWLAIRMLSPDPWTPVVAAMIVAFVPRFLFLAGVLNNDNLATLLGAVATFLAVWLVSRRPDTIRVRVAWAAGAGIVLGAALLTKVTAVVIGPALVLALCLVVRGARDRLALAAVMGIGGFVMSGWWLVRNQMLYGDPVGNAASVAHLRALFPALFPHDNPVIRAFVTIPEGVWKSAWYTSGWNQFSWPPAAYVPFWILLGIGLVSVVARRSAGSWDGISVLILMSVGGAAVIWIVGLQTTQVQARIGFVGLPAIAGLTALGYERMRFPMIARFALPTLGFLGVLIAIRLDILGVFH
jgi:hypothetical protein